MNNEFVHFEDEIDHLLAEGVDGARDRESSAFDRAVGPGPHEFVLFGAGNLGRRTLECLRRTGITPLCFIDNDSSKWGKTLDGISIMSPLEGIKHYNDRAVFIVTIWRGEGVERMRDRIAQLRHLGCSAVIPFLSFYWKHAKTLLPHYALDLPHLVHLQSDNVREAFRLLSDDNSRREYISELRFRLLGDFDGLPDPVPGDIYFRDEFFEIRDDEFFVDCGAYDGDTIASLLLKTHNRFQRIVGFEPDPENYTRLIERIGKLPPSVRAGIVLHNAATGKANEISKMKIGGGPSSFIGEGDHEVQSYNLDFAVSGSPVSILKMDIEGSELATLEGAQNLIRQFAPILTICVYHRQDDLWNIPLTIHKLNPAYSIYLRPHLLEGWDLVCYAVPPHRLLNG